MTFVNRAGGKRAACEPSRVDSAPDCMLRLRADGDVATSILVSGTSCGATAPTPCHRHNTPQASKGSTLSRRLQQYAIQHGDAENAGMENAAP